MTRVLRDFSGKLFAVRRMRSAITDCVLLTLVAIGVNLLIAPGDLGFGKLSPSPYLLIPVIIGCRHGLRPGLLSGILISAMAILRTAIRGHADDWSVEENLWEAVAPPLIGFICGGAVTTLLGRLRVIRNEAARLRRTSLMMSAEIRMLRHDMDESIRNHLIGEVRRIHLEDDLRALMVRDKEELPDAMMAILRNHAQVREAALYRIVDDGTRLERERLLGGDRHLPQSVELKDFPMLEQAVELGRVTSASVHAPIGVIVNRPHLVAAPIVFGKSPTHLLVIADVPLIAFSTRTVRLVAIVCKCMEECFAMTGGGVDRFKLVPGGLNRRIYTARAFREHLAAYARFASEDMTEWRLCVIAARNRKPGAKEALERAVMPLLDAEDITHSPDGELPVLFVILPWSNRNGAIRFEKRLVAGLRETAPELDATVELFRNPDATRIRTLMSTDPATRA